MSPKIIISEEAYDQTISFFEKDFEVVLFKQQDRPYKAVGHHPDMFMFYDDKLFKEPCVHLEGIACEHLGSKYPETVKYNIAKVGNFVICKWQSISEVIKDHILEMGYEVIDVNQGYAKCSTAVIGHSIITSDKGIYEACKDKIKSLLISPGYIELPGLDYGFIGGTCVSLDKQVFFNGDITKHPDFKSIKAFIESENKDIVYVNEPLKDIGSFIIIERSD